MRTMVVNDFELNARLNESVCVGSEVKWEVDTEVTPWNVNNELHNPQSGTNASTTYSDLLDFLSPAEAADLPDLDFPVPNQDVIPEMVYETDELPQHPNSGGTPATISSTQITSGKLVSAAVNTTPSSYFLNSMNSPPVESFPASGHQLIPIQSSIIAHARSGQRSIAVMQERRAKNTESARRSRARRVDKLSILRRQNDDLEAANSKLVHENRSLKERIQYLESQLLPKKEVE